MGQDNSKKFVYSTPVTEPKEGESSVYRCASHVDHLLCNPSSGARTLQQMFLQNFKTAPKRDYLGYVDEIKNEKGEVTSRNYKWLTNREVEERSRWLGSAIISLGLAPEKSQYKDFKLKFVGVQGKNCLEWFLLDIANVCYGLTTMPLYDTLGEEAVEWMLTETELETLFITRALMAKTIQRHASGKSKFLKNLVIMDDAGLTEKDWEILTGIKVYRFTDLLEIGKKSILPYPTVTPDEVAFFSYTSGTTGKPKGAMVTNRNIMSAIAGAEVRMFFITPDSRYLSYLPLAHVFEKICYLYLTYVKGRIGIYGGDVAKIDQDLALLKPTFFASVPRMLNKFYEGINKKMGAVTGISGAIARRGLKSKLHELDSKGGFTDGLYDPLVFNKVKKLLGGECHGILSSSAPIAIGVKKFLKVALCCPLIEGYGQTEGVGGQFCQDINETDLDNVGGPLPMNEFKLVDVPEMGYTHKDKDEQGRPSPRGEIFVRGPNIIVGYYKNDEKNKESFTEDGWLRSGDIGVILPGNNALRIIDRKKNIFKLSHGEYVAPEKLEQFYKTTPGIADIFVYGSSLKSSLVGIVNIDERTIRKFAQEKKIDVEALKLPELVKDGKILQLVKDLLRKTADETGLKGFERIESVYIDPVAFADQELITTTFKLKRNEASALYKTEIEKLYTGKD